MFQHNDTKCGGLGYIAFHNILDICCDASSCWTFTSWRPKAIRTQKYSCGLATFYWIIFSLQWDHYVDCKGFKHCALGYHKCCRKIWNFDVLWSHIIDFYRTCSNMHSISRLVFGSFGWLSNFNIFSIHFTHRNILQSWPSYSFVSSLPLQYLSVSLVARDERPKASHHPRRW